MDTVAPRGEHRQVLERGGRGPCIQLDAAMLGALGISTLLLEASAPLGVEAPGQVGLAACKPSIGRDLLRDADLPPQGLAGR